jgi:hypothetical protein
MNARNTVHRTVPRLAETWRVHIRRSISPPVGGIDGRVVPLHASFSAPKAAFSEVTPQVNDVNAAGGADHEPSEGPPKTLYDSCATSATTSPSPQPEPPDPHSPILRLRPYDEPPRHSIPMARRSLSEPLENSATILSYSDCITSR